MSSSVRHETPYHRHVPRFLIRVIVLALVAGGCAAPIPSRASETPSPTRFGVLPADLGPDADRVIERIAIGACLLDPTGGAALADIGALDPDLMLWLGDNVYGDVMRIEGDMAGLRHLYRQLGANDRFRQLAEQTTLLATWDDHDYGRNDAGEEWVFKATAKRLFLEFWGDGAGDPRAAQSGVYSARTFGTGDRTVQVILLDNRSERDAYSDDPSHTMLGDEQWAWLRERLLEPATIRIIGSGIQVVNDYDPPTGVQWESWGDMPSERERLFALVRETGASGTILVSGDMHHAELSRLADDQAGFGYATYDLTGSGLDRNEEELWPNPARIGTVLNTDRKFGFITIEWGADPVIRLQIHDGASGTVHLEHAVHLSELAPSV
jgi:alkaline phosphatase D